MMDGDLGACVGHDRRNVQLYNAFIACDLTIEKMMFDQ
jgi:hypothetical protein